MSELFSRLRRTRQSEQQAVSVAFFQFMVCPGEKGVSVRAVDARLKDVDISGYVGDATVRAAAKTFCDILQKQSWQINWGKPSGSKSVSAADYPHFLHQLMRCGNIVAPVPGSRKAQAVHDTLASKAVDPMVPASLLITHPSCWLFLDEESASLCPAEMRDSRPARD